MDAPNTPPGFSQCVTPAAALVEQWRSGNVLRYGDEAATERVDPAVSVDQRPRVEMPVSNAVEPLLQAPSTTLPFVNDWTPSFSPQEKNLGSGGGGSGGAEILSTIFQGLSLSGIQGGVENTTNNYFLRKLPQPSLFPGASAPPTSYMIHGFPNYVAPPNAIDGGDSGISSTSLVCFTSNAGYDSSSSTFSSVRFTNEEALVCQNPMGAERLYPDKKRSGNKEQRGVERAMNREELTLLLRLLKENINTKTINDVLHVVCSRDVHCTMADELGSQVFVALLDACNDRQMEALVLTATYNGVKFTKVAGKTNFGCRCIKKVVEKVKTSPELSRCVANALAVGAHHLMTADNGRDVLKHCFKNLSYDRTFVLVKAAAEGFMEYATDVKGCSTLKYCISQARDPLRRFMMVKVATNALQLATHYYGTYVVQHVIDVEDSEDVKESIFLTMASNFVQVATNKCGSFVLEKFLYIPKFGSQLCRVIASYGLSRPEVLEQIARDKHGNYVLQGALEVSVGAEPGIHRLLVCAIAGLPRSLMNDPYANKLYKTAFRDLQSRQ